MTTTVTLVTIYNHPIILWYYCLSSLCSIVYPCDIYHRGFTPFKPPTYFAQPSTAFPSGNQLFAICMSLSVLLVHLIFLWIKHLSEITPYMSFSV